MEVALRLELRLRRGAAAEVKSLRADEEDAERSTQPMELVAGIMLGCLGMVKYRCERMEEVSRLISFRSD